MIRTCAYSTCRVSLIPEDSGGFRMESGRPAWEEGHIPGSGFVDFTTDLSDQHSDLAINDAARRPIYRYHGHVSG